jgi:hypothetical protein
MEKIIKALRSKDTLSIKEKKLLNLATNIYLRAVKELGIIK